jgi:hypothetical protein
MSGIRVAFIGALLSLAGCDISINLDPGSQAMSEVGRPETIANLQQAAGAPKAR